jgi:hypothetical protein
MIACIQATGEIMDVTNEPHYESIDSDVSSFMTELLPGSPGLSGSGVSRQMTESRRLKGSVNNNDLL